ncbi:acyltransferase [Photobacterium phosphoreum]|uniref:acyltransferase n=1 Tax=Photobacterium phosphoreum TaxID=659 RepID=UPI002433314B|nr:acyltransferase [Photobacterium phosphoreum]
MNINGKIYESTKIINRQNIFLGINSQIDDFCFINAGLKTQMGRNVHIASFTSIIGGGECYIGDFAGLSVGCRLITATDNFSGPFLTNPTVPSQYTDVKVGYIKIGKHAIIGTNSIIFPNIEIGEGCAVGAGAVIRKNLKPWTVYAMVSGQLTELKKRDADSVLEIEKKYLEEN